MIPRYFVGAANDLGTVSALPQQDFLSLCNEVIQAITQLPLTREAYHALPNKQRDRAKRSQYLTPATFTRTPSARKTEFGAKANLLAIDVDDAADARRLLDSDWSQLGDLAFVVWQTASSTPEAPRLRIMVSAEGVPLSRYAVAVRTVGEMLGLTNITRESLVPVQPMYLPVVFADAGDPSPIVICKPEGEPFLTTDVLSESDLEDDSTDDMSGGDGVVADLDFLRNPLEGISPDDVRSALATLDPDMPMQDWVTVGMGLRHQFGDDGYDLWREWSAKGNKFTGDEDTEKRWQSFKSQPTHRIPVTIRSVFRKAQAAGWTDAALTTRTREELTAWITHDTRTTEELLDHGSKKIAQVSSLLGVLGEKAMMTALKNTMQKRGMTLTLPDIRKEVARIKTESARQTGVPKWARGFCFVSSKGVFYKYTTDRVITPETLDLMYGGSLASHGEDDVRPREYLINSVGIPQVENLRYEPKYGEKRFFTEDGVPYVNIYRPGNVAPDYARMDEARDVFLNHVANLVHEPAYQKRLIDFLAYHVQHPGAKIRWAILLQGAQGCGKTFLAHAMTAVLGRRNVAKVAASNVLEDKFNDWAYGHQLVVMDEIRVIGHNRYGVMDKLKPCISDDTVSLRAMREAARTVPNVTNYLMFTNYHDSLAIHDEDRRYFVLQSPLQRKEQIDALGGSAYFDRLFSLVTDNAGGLKAFFEKWDIASDFNPEGRAEVTPYLRDLVENSASPLTAAVRQAISEEPLPLVRKDLVSMSAVRGLVQHCQGVSEFSDQTLAAVLREMGWTKAERVMLEGERHTLWVKDLDPRTAKHVATTRWELY
jgi:hypothetical protein